MLAGLILAFIGIGVLVLRYVPLGNKMMRWETPAPEFDEVFRSWRQAQYIRTFFYVCGFIAFIVGLAIR
jgi:hypothetical protein